MNMATSQATSQPDRERNTQALENKPRARGNDELIADSSLFSSFVYPFIPPLLEPNSPIENTAPISKAPHSIYLPPHLNDEMVLNSLEVQISDELNGKQPSFNCTLILPHLGEVKMNASQSSSQWHINLAFNKPEALEYLRRTQSTATHRLREKLGANVILGLSLIKEKVTNE